MGRPSKLTPQLIEEFKKNTLLGLPRLKVCDLLEISHVTMYEWINIANQVIDGCAPEEKNTDHDLCVKFLNTIKKAEATWQQKMLEKMHTDQYWQREMTLLERRDPAHWRRQDTLQVTPDAPQSADDLTDEQLAAIIRRG